MRTDSSAPKEVLIIGSGIGGLSTAILLAQLGFRPVVIEKNRTPGGLMRSYTREGMECAVGVHYLGALDKGQVLRRLFDFMGVSPDIPTERMGADGVIDRYLFDDFTFDLPEGLDAYEDKLRKTFPDEGTQITRIMETLRDADQKIRTLDFMFSAKSDFSMIEASRPFGEMLSEMGCSPGLRAVLGVPCCWIGVPLASCPAFYHNMVLATYLSSSWRLRCSGSEMAGAFADRLRSLGGQILAGDGVGEILVNSRVVRGVRLKSGAILEAPTVIAAIHPKVVLSMLPDDAVKPSYRKRISNLEDTEGMFSAQVSVDAASHTEIPWNIFKIQIHEDGAITDMKYYQFRKSEQPRKSLFTILTSGTPERWEKWGNTLTGRRGEAYLREKETRAWQLIREAEDIFGPLQGPRLIDTYTPLTLRDWIGSPGGSAYGVLRSSRQLLSAALLNRTAVKGLFLAGQSVMAPGILGTLLGSLSTIRLIIGPERFVEVFNDLRGGRLGDYFF